MRRARAVGLCLALVVGIVAPASGEETKRRPKARVKETVKEAGKTAGHAARDGALTFGRSTRAFFTGGAAAAKRTWKQNAARTKANAKAGARATKDAAR